jgi:hypothetical protein
MHALPRTAFSSLLLLLTLCAAGCSSPLRTQIEHFESGRVAYALSWTESPYSSSMTIVPSTGIRLVAVQSASSGPAVRVVDDRGGEYRFQIEETDYGFEVEGWNTGFPHSTRFVVGRGGKLMFLDDRGFEAWARGERGWWNEPEGWTNSFQATSY